jgi:uncharacterized damage-inducible protein DinB
MKAGERAAQIEQYGNAYELLVEALAQFPREMWQYRPSPDEWTIHEIILHITDSEANGFIRARRLVAEPGLELMGYDQLLWSQALAYQALNPVTALELFRWLRQSTYELISNLPDETWTHTVQHPDLGTYSMQDWLEIYTRHVPNHITQMMAVYDAWLEESPES